MRFIKVLLVISLLATALIYMSSRSWELDLIANLQANAAVPIGFMQFISDSISFFSLGIPIVMLIVGFVRRNRALRENALAIMLSIGLAGLISASLKKTVREPRPYEVDSRISQWSGGGGYGFPSGHTVEAVAAATAFTILVPEVPVVLAAFLWAFTIMFSRIYLGVHDPGDVMAGTAIGIVSALIIFRIRDSLRQRRTTAPSE